MIHRGCVLAITDSANEALEIMVSRLKASPVYGWFTEGFGTRDLKEARVLLDELAP